MKDLTCGVTRGRLHAFHDRELSIGDEIAVGAHLERCDDCAAVSKELGAVRDALRIGAAWRPGLSSEDAAGFGIAVVTRLKAEQDASLAARVRLMFEDWHLVYAGAGAAGAALVCVLMMTGMMRFANDDRPDSLAAIMNVLAMPMECETGVDTTDSECRARLAERVQRANEAAEQDAVFMLDSVVTRQGRLASLALLRSSRRQKESRQAQVIEGLLDTVRRARFDLSPAGLPMNTPRAVAHAAGRAGKQQAAELPLPPIVKKRAASQGNSAYFVVA